MSVNDILVQGAEPLFFLDYYVCERLDVAVARRRRQGHRGGLRAGRLRADRRRDRRASERVPPGEYDLAGFAVGVVEKSKAIDGRRIAAGDVLLGLASSGPHSNGFSLIRRILEVSGANLAPIAAAFRGRRSATRCSRRREST